jgi:predicted anti-sigma-YlaC factor YlaD
VNEIPCSEARELISARIDGELGFDDADRLDRHTGSCVACTDYQDDGFALRRSLRMSVVQAETEPAPVPAAPRSVIGSLRGLSALRWALFVIGGTLVLLNVPSILSAEASPAAHLDRHDGVFGTALGIGMLAVAAKPHRAIGLVPITGATAVLMLVVAAADVISGNANLLTEAIHVVQFAGLVCLWVISGGPSRLSTYTAALTRLRPTQARG